MNAHVEESLKAIERGIKACSVAVGVGAGVGLTIWIVSSLRAVIRGG